MKKTLLFIVVCCHAICFSNDKETRLVEHVKFSLKRAFNKKSKLQEPVFKVDGMSGRQTRHFMNNLCSLENASYFEVGVYKGSTLIASLYGNESTLSQAIAVDDFNSFGGPRDIFHSNVRQLIPKAPLQFYEQDAFKLDKNTVFAKPVNIYLYDGAHNYKSQYDAFLYFDEVFDDVFISVVDDWNWEPVREGTYDAIRDLEYEILFEKEIPTEEGSIKNLDGWWNGMYVFVAKKKSR